VQTGVARTGSFFAFEHANIRPDVLTLGKGLGGGFPIAALLASSDAACFEDGDHGSTFGGNAVGSAVALAVVAELTSSEGSARREASSRYLLTTLHDLAGRLKARLRGRGHLFGLVLPEDRAPALRDACFERGLLINAARPNVLRFMPQLFVSAAEIDEMRETLISVC
jgi:acetylornithine/N-succinyldiaminopimelate aminotransferase